MVGILSDIGNVRKVNEDFAEYFEDSKGRFYVIADGMGGHNAGEVASKVSVRTMIDYLKELKSFRDIKSVLKEAVKTSNNKIYEMSKNNSDLYGMGTTVTACLIVGDKVGIANVGDSRCYILKNDELIKVTKDHSLVQELLDNGSITEEEAFDHPNKNIITRSLGTFESVEADIFILPLKGIQKIILCSDGLSNHVRNEEILNIIKNNTNQDSCVKLVDMSKENGSRDNISVIICEGECKDDRYFIGE